MKEYLFKKIDAFSTENSSGNPAGYVLLNNQEDISEPEMLHIAKEMKGFVNEVGYVVPSDGGFKMKYYSSTREVDFCGHATVAIFYDIFKNSSAYREKKEITITTNKGKLQVENKLEGENAVFILSPVPVKISPVPQKEDICEYLRISKSEINSNLPIEIINAGLNTLIVPINSLDSILGIAPSLEELKLFCVNSGLDIIIVFSEEVSDLNSNFRTRVFAPTFGYLEDPATGSGNSAFGYYLMNNEMWQGDTINIEQNSHRQNFNRIKLQQKKDDKELTRVSFGGGAITRLEGKYFTHSQND